MCVPLRFFPELTATREGDREMSQCDIFTIKNILRKIGDVDWKALGIKLNFDPAKLIEIECKHRGLIGDCRYNMIEFWLTNDTSASWEKLEAALATRSVRTQEVMRDLESE